jgi:hypothetical protein
MQKSGPQTRVLGSKSHRSSTGQSTHTLAHCLTTPEASTHRHRLMPIHDSSFPPFRSLVHMLDILFTIRHRYIYKYISVRYARRTQSSAGPQLEHLASLPIALREVLPVHEVVVHPHGRVPHDIACMHTTFRL